MELMLKIDLTDEQYNDLMKKSYYKVFDDEEFASAMRKTVADSMADYLRKNPEIVKKAIVGTDNYYSRNAKATELGKNIMNVATAEYSSEISDAVKDSIRQILKSVNISDLLWKIISEAVLKGMTEGIRLDLEAERYCVNNMNGIVNQMREKLNI